MFFSLSASAQKDTTKVDTAQLFFNEVGNGLTIKDFQQWLYKNIVAIKYEEFMQLYNTYLQQQFTAWIEEKKKKK